MNCRNMAAMDYLNQDCTNEEYYEQYKNDVMFLLSDLYPNITKKIIIECKRYETKYEVFEFY
jgi:hypothetical protein